MELKKFGDHMDIPEWQMDDAYGDIGSSRYEESVSEINSCIKKFREKSSYEKEKILNYLAVYERAVIHLSSIKAFLKCVGAKDFEDVRIASESRRLIALGSELESVSHLLFESIEQIDFGDPLWDQEPLRHWAFEIKERQKNWTHKLSPQLRKEFEIKRAQYFEPLGDRYKDLQKKVSFTARDSNGNKVTIRQAKMVAILKGDPDPTLRRTTGEELVNFYKNRQDIYADLLNKIQGFRLSFFRKVGADPLEVSLHQNRMSKKALNAMLKAIRLNIGVVRESISLRSPWFHDNEMQFWDLMAPAPVKVDNEMTIPYSQGIAMVCEALGKVNQQIPDFIQLMLDHRWLDAKPSDNKVGGAFYTRFNEFRIPRVFTTYRGTVSSVIQQSHELGHAFHYWVMRDLPVIETEFPMTLTETASTFNEAVLRRYLFEISNPNDRFPMLWQELRSWGNFLLNTTARMDFELQYLRERDKGDVSAERCCDIMKLSWQKWYGCTATPDQYLWAYKLHFYKTDQFIYNYPYTVGFLLSQALLCKWDVNKDGFFDFYIKMLRDTGRMTLDQIVKQHFGGDAGDVQFWSDAMAPLKGYLEQFRKYSVTGTPVSLN